jgi:hypothetical protein
MDSDDKIGEPIDFLCSRRAQLIGWILLVVCLAAIVWLIGSHP